MSLWLRRTAAVLLMGFLLGFVFYLHAGGPANPFPEEGDYPYPDSRSCKPCHSKIYDEWESSLHAQSWKDPLVRKLSRDFKEVDCIPCHAPQPLLLTGLSVPPLGREKQRKEGVSCLSCHRVREGIAVSRIPGEGPCRPLMDERVRSVDLCRGCHNLHGTVDDWAATPLKKEGRDCYSCHMPLTKRENNKEGRSHEWPGGHSKEMIGRAVRFGALVDDEKGLLIIEIENSGAGHNVPTELRHRALDLRVTIKEGWFNKDTYLYRFRNPYKGEGGPNTQLKFGERRKLTYPLPVGKGEARIELVYRMMFHGEGSDDEVVQEKRVPFHVKRKRIDEKS